MNVVIIGAGTLGQRWTQIVNSSTNAKIQAFVDPLIGNEKAPAWLLQYPEIPKFNSIPELRDLQVEAAIITAFSPAHAEAVEQALAQNYHVLVEKPFVTNQADAKRLVQLAGQKKRKLMVSQNYRFFPG
ncbi:MAG: Gfo/Idh/MocA family oxidoreductase, partial [Verrucomicrobia bacterium]|nr:Gfo/Idh/MocA family oxidoreductase [Verrucomicrobiota bacterium]